MEGGNLRASDDDRERVAALLRDHFSAGRLSDEELSHRIGRTYSAKTVRELDALTSDLPAAAKATSPVVRRGKVPQRTTRAGHALRASVKIHTTIFVLVNVMLIAIWALTGGGYFWPVWSILGWGVGLGAHAAPLIAGVGKRPVRPEELESASISEVAESVQDERPSLASAAAPDGTVTILFTDIVGSTELNDRLGDLRWLELLRVHHELVRAQITRHDGFEVKVQGDSFMIAFPSARRAAHCAREIQTAIEARLGTDPEAPVRVRAGLHTGEAVREEDDFYGRNVVLAARITGEAQAGEILASSVVKELIDSGGDISFGEPREVELKGLGTYRVYPISG
jgi:class 3 adenylate cyclase